MELTAKSPRIAGIVAASCNRPSIVVLVVLVLAIWAVAYSAQHFAMTTDTAKLISPDVPWWQNKAAFDTAFPQQNDLIVAVVDGATAELTALGAAELAARLSTRTDLFQSVKQPEGEGVTLFRSCAIFPSPGVAPSPALGHSSRSITRPGRGPRYFSSSIELMILWARP